MAFTEDFSEFTDSSEFGVTAAFSRLAGSTLAEELDVDGIFQGGYLEGAGQEGAQPVFGCAAADVPGVKHDDELAIAGTDYVVKGVQPDGTGWMRLVLELAP